MVSLKGAFYQFCFFLGLGTLGFYSFGQIQTWVSGDAPKRTRSAFERKVRALQEQPTQGEVQEKIIYVEVPAKPIALPVVKEVASLSSPTADLAAASPSPSPTATPEATADANAAPKTDAEGLQQSPEQNGGMPSYAQPIFPFAMAPEMAPPSPEVKTIDPAAATPMVGAGYPLANSNSNTLSYPATVRPATTTPSNNLAKSDLALLALSLKGVFNDQKDMVSGNFCDASSGATTPTCNRVQSYEVHTSRWDKTSGLMSDATVSVSAASTSAVQFSVNLKIQDDQLAVQNYSAGASASEVSARSETRSGRNYRIIDFKLPDLSVRGGKDVLSSVQVSLVYDITNAAAPVVSNASALNFVRNKVITINSSWDASPNRMPSSAITSTIEADQVIYSMMIEKS